MLFGDIKRNQKIFPWTFVKSLDCVCNLIQSRFKEGKRERGESLVLDECLKLKDQASRDGQHGLCIVLLRHFIEELDNVREVHVVLQDDLPIILHQSQSDEEDEIVGCDLLR